jgi:hypothetical protein
MPSRARTDATSLSLLIRAIERIEQMFPYGSDVHAVDFTLDQDGGVS